MSDNNGTFLLKEKDFVKVVDDEGNEVEGLLVPKHWDNDQLPAGFKKKSGRATTAAATPPPADQEPAGNASRDDWAAYAKAAKDAKDEDLVDGDGKELTRDELKAKYGSAS